MDATNAHVDDPPDISPAGVTRSRAALARTGRTSSEIVAAWAPAARLVKSISTVPMGWIEDATGLGLRTALFTSGDDAGAKRVVIALLDGAGFAPVDLGTLREGGVLQEVGAPLSGLHLYLRRRLRQLRTNLPITRGRGGTSMNLRLTVKLASARDAASFITGADLRIDRARW